MIMIYAKAKDQKRFKPLDYRGGVQVSNLIHATMWLNEDRPHVDSLVNQMNKDNPAWTFETRCKK